MYIYNLGLLFESIVRKYPSNDVIRFPDNRRVAYHDLNRAANQYARLFLSKGIRTGDVVCIAGQKIFATYVSMIACLKIGAPYVILDPDNPIERLARIVQKCMPKLMIGEIAFTDTVKKSLHTADWLSLDSVSLDGAATPFDFTDLEETAHVPGTTPAYIMFTSGSTGFPKGAVILHHSVMNFINWCVDTFGFTPEDILTNVNPLHFDNSVFDFYSAVFSGASLVPFSKELTAEPRRLVELIDETGCTSWFSVPSMLIYLQTMKVLSGDNMKSITRFIFGGEGYPKGRLKDLFDLYSNRAVFYNVYGPTECTCMCSSYVLSPDDFADLQGFPPLGNIARNFGYLILDEDKHAVADDETGVLFLSGPNVGPGYYNDPEQTASRFVQNPYNQRHREFMYDTGDLVEYSSADGKLHIKGRKDHQIKHMGYRIELEEIENALCALEYVAQAAVIHKKNKGLSQIVGVVCLKSQKVDSTRIRTDLRTHLPEYMIPQAIHFVPELPKNANGKIDRLQLLEMY